MSSIREITYDFDVVPTIKNFMRDKSFIQGLMGPFGSGKSSGCVMKLLRIASSQLPDNDGIRYTRFAIVRSSYRQLTDTTKQTILDWLRPLGIKWKESDHSFLLEYIDKRTNTEIHSEWLLRALDRPDQVDNLFSLELTAAWLNEAVQLPKEVFETVQGRVGRYPKRGRVAPTWHGVIMDTNPPDTDHWWYKFFEEAKPPNAKIFYQPSGLSEEAENLPYLPQDYYTNMMIGKDEEWVRVYIEGNYGYLRTGKPVFPNFKDSTHVWKEDLKVIIGVPVHIGIDFGTFPAAVIAQLTPKGHILILDELVSEDSTDIDEFTKTRLRPLLQSKYAKHAHLIIGDPAGSIKSQVDNKTCFSVLRSYGYNIRPAYTNSLAPRLMSVNDYLTRTIEGKPAFILSPSAKFLRKALNGGYCYRRLLASGERYTDVPDKNLYSHVTDALQYVCLGTVANFHQTIEKKYNKYYTDKQLLITADSWA